MLMAEVKMQKANESNNGRGIGVTVKRMKGQNKLDMILYVTRVPQNTNI